MKILKEDNFGVDEMLKILKIVENILIEKKILQKSQQRFKSNRCNLSTIKVNKIALTSAVDERLQIRDCKKTFAYGTSRKILEEWKKFLTWLRTMKKEIIIIFF